MEKSIKRNKFIYLCILKHEIRGYMILIVLNITRGSEQNLYRGRERPWQRKTRAFGEERGSHLHVNSCTPLEFLMYS